MTVRITASLLKEGRTSHRLSPCEQLYPPPSRTRLSTSQMKRNANRNREPELNTKRRRPEKTEQDL
jgi:hypothetical protein